MNRMFGKTVFSTFSLRFTESWPPLLLLFLMLQRFPVESKARRKKLQVGYVTTVCFSCFLIRCIMVCFNAFNQSADLDVLDHPVLNLIYYLASLFFFSCTGSLVCLCVTVQHPVK